jgi:hypothetical protein
MAARFIKPLMRAFLDTTGRAAPGAKLYFYETESETPKATYSDVGLTTPNTNPVIANSTGRFGPIFLSDGYYKVILKDTDDATIWTEDKVGVEDGAAIYLTIENNLSDVQEASVALDNIGGVPLARNLTAGIGLTGGGTLENDRTFDVDFATEEEVEAATEEEKAISPATLPAGIAAYITDNVSIPEIDDGSDSDEVDFPIGHHVVVNSSSVPDRNKTATIYLDTGATGRYTTTSGGETLLGTWRSRGQISTTGNDSVLMQRVG